MVTLAILEVASVKNTIKDTIERQRAKLRQVRSRQIRSRGITSVLDQLSHTVRAYLGFCRC